MAMARCLIGAEGGEHADNAALAARRSMRAHPVAARFAIRLSGGFSLTGTRSLARRRLRRA